MVVGFICILLVTVGVVAAKIVWFTPAENLNISTFRPLPQQKNDANKYNGFGYIPCNGFVPCQVSRSREELV